MTFFFLGVPSGINNGLRTVIAKYKMAVLAFRTLVMFHFEKETHSYSPYTGHWKALFCCCGESSSKVIYEVLYLGHLFYILEGRK